jgi:hypothetical protein
MVRCWQPASHLALSTIPLGTFASWMRGAREPFNRHFIDTFSFKHHAFNLHDIREKGNYGRLGPSRLHRDGVTVTDADVRSAD